MAPQVAKKDLSTHTLRYAVRLGDDALILGQRLSEWVSCAPFLEEDIALANVALDYIGRARMYYQYAASLSPHHKSEDDFAFLRGERDFENYLINELPRGDFADTIVRQLIVDIYNFHYLSALRHSKDQALAAIADKSHKETRYHLRRSRLWTVRLGDGTEESHQRMQRAIDEIWGYTHELFTQDSLEQLLVEKNIAVDTASLRTQWFTDISATFQEATLTLPDTEWAIHGGRKGYHTEYLGRLLSEMQFLHRSYPGCQW